jgi:pheromone alpha factor receptor
MSGTVAATPSPDPTSAAWNIYLDNQNFNVTGLDGTPTTLNLGDIRVFLHGTATQSIVYGFGVGFCSMLAIVLILLTDSKKLRKPIYILNILSLVLYTFRSILAAIIQTTGATDGIASEFLSALAEYPKAEFAPLIMAYTIQPFLYATILGSLILQVRVVFAAEPVTQNVVTAILGLAALALVALQLFFCISLIIYEAGYNFSISYAPVVDKVYYIIRIYFATFVAISCIVFLYKLAVTIHRRRKMGIKRFGPLQIVFIMFSQCLIIPRMFLTE